MNSRSAQLLAATLAFLLIVLVGATIFILLSGPRTPGPTATPSLPPSGCCTMTPGPTTSGTPLPSATGSASPTPIVLPTDTPSPTLEPTITPTPSPSATPSPSPTPSPTLPPPGDNLRQVTVVNVGLDQRADVFGVQRTVSVFVDGPSIITAELRNVNAGKVRMCILRNEADPQKACITAHSGKLTRPVFDLGRTRWNVTLFGTSGVAGQFATLDVTFNTLSPRVELDSFRFNGTNDPHYNGFEIVFGPNAASGDFHLGAVFSDDNPYTWHLHVGPDDASGFDKLGGPSTSVNETTPIDSGTVYSVLFEYPEPSAAVLLDDVVLTWP